MSAVKNALRGRRLDAGAKQALIWLVLVGLEERLRIHHRLALRRFLLHVVHVHVNILEAGEHLEEAQARTGGRAFDVHLVVGVDHLDVGAGAANDAVVGDVEDFALVLGRGPQVAEDAVLGLDADDEAEAQLRQQQV